MPICATVLKSGGEFTVDHLQHFVREFALFTQRWTRRNNFIPPRLVCLTDLDPETLPEGIEAIPMVDAWDEPWTVLELFKPGLFPTDEAVLYFRLDTDLVGDFLDVFDAVDAIEVNRFRDTRVDEIAFVLTEFATLAEVYDSTDDPTAALSEIATVDIAAYAVDTSGDIAVAITAEAGTPVVAIAVSDTGIVVEGTPTLDVSVARIEGVLLSAIEAKTILALLARTDTPTVSLAEVKALMAAWAGTDTPTAAITEASAVVHIGGNPDIGAFEYVP